MADTIKILDGSTFVVSDRRGDIDAAPDQPHGLFFRDTRFLSRWILSLEGRSLEILSTDDVDYFSAQFFLYPPTGTIYSNPDLSVIRQRTVGDGLHEDLILLNHSQEPVDVGLRMEAGADFADLFEVKDAQKKVGELYRDVRDGSLVLGYGRDDFVRETVITAGEPADVGEEGLTFRVTVPPHGEWQTCIDVIPQADTLARPKHGHGSVGSPAPNMEMSLKEWMQRAPVLESSWDKLGHIYWRSLVDLAALRFYPDISPEASLPAAGLPWFMALFGRDSVITSFQSLPFTPELAETTLRVLADQQGKEVDDFRDEEPGKILHELRVGELTHFGERPHSPYYGTADATPLWLVLLDETERWTGNADLVRELEPNARAALAWIDEFGDRDGDGYVEYERRNTETGLENQCWKDSWNSILFADGTNSKLPRATCEIQGYVYDAKRRCARLARELWGDPDFADQLEKEAQELRARFNRDFWIPGREFFALALDGDKRKVDSLTSNIGHLLWSGIVDEEKAEAVAQHLMSERMFSGWGVRTMAEGEGGYNPIEYHNGTVWPHDNSFIAAGLRRYGYAEDAARIGYALLEAATYFDWRLPEVFAGYPRSLTSFPVEYPTASSPQAWATGTPLLLLRVMLGLEPDGDRLASEPVLPPEIDELALRGIQGRWKDADVTARRS
ncbi:MAG TPA: glycogen debranching N-terminal domain-containing protein [Actinomycetota bacterium]|jgi:glycogen debranching enzyme|nr:glycogen debranching N-terminal domain-containing protein [Actinomycetota bacterium]